MISLNHRHLECFLVLADKLHFGKAAEKLFIAQPPLSRIIKELETELAVTLFKRSSRSVELTKAGLFLKEETIKLFANINHLKEQIKEIDSGKSTKLRIGYVGAAMHSLLPKILNDLSQKLNIGLVLFELKNDEQIAALHVGQIDFGFVRSVPANAGVISLPLLSETFSLILPLKHKLASKKKIQLRELADDTFIGLNYDCAPKLCDTIFEICTKSGFYPKIGHETSQMNSIVRLVESGLGYSIVPTSVKNAYALKVKFIELVNNKQKAELFLIHKKEMPSFIENCLKEIKVSSGYRV